MLWKVNFQTKIKLLKLNFRRKKKGLNRFFRYFHNVLSTLLLYKIHVLQKTWRFPRPQNSRQHLGMSQKFLVLVYTSSCVCFAAASSSFSSSLGDWEIWIALVWLGYMNQLLLQHLHGCLTLSSWVCFKTLFSSKTFSWVFCKLIILPWVCCCYCQSFNGFRKRKNLRPKLIYTVLVVSLQLQTAK